MKYKYKRRIATGAIAFSLLVGGSSVFAVTPQDLGANPNPPKSTQTFPKPKKPIVKIVKNSNIVGTVSSVNSTGFVVDVKNIKKKTTSAIDVITSSTTVYTKDGKKGTVVDLAVGQKVIVVGTLDKTTNIVTASKVKIITKVVTTKVKKSTPKTTNSSN